MPEWELKAFDSREGLAEALANHVAAQLSQAIDARGKALLVVSGGSTPAPFFDALAQQSLDWSKLTVMMADERWVASDHLDSNEKLLRTHLLNKQPALTLFSLAPHEGESLNDGSARLNSQLKELGCAPDICILGMGEDGHTASLFPDHPMLEQGLNPAEKNLCLAVTDSPKPPPQRITLSAAFIHQSRELMLHITGEAKRAKLEHDAASPARRLLAQHPTQPIIYWAA